MYFCGLIVIDFIECTAAPKNGSQTCPNDNGRNEKYPSKNNGSNEQANGDDGNESINSSNNSSGDGGDDGKDNEDWKLHEKDSFVTSKKKKKKKKKGENDDDSDSDEKDIN